MVAAVRVVPAALGNKPRSSPPTPGLAVLDVVPTAAEEQEQEQERLSDADTTASSTAAPNSSLSSGSSAASLSSRLSFDCSPSAALAQLVAGAPSVSVSASCTSTTTTTSTSTSTPPSRPHRSGDAAWAAIRAASTSAAAPLGARDFHLVRRVGSGDVGAVYLCRLRSEPEPEPEPGPCPCPASGCSYYAMKVVDRRVVAKKKKLERAAAERRILRVLDHPFLPTLFADFDAPPHFSCVVTEFCPGGDLHSLRHRMPNRRFPLASARFYAAEVLLALEYLHMLGIVYRDLKPENVLIRGDGHIMLTDFDLSLESTTSPSVEPDDVVREDDEEPATSVSCFPDHLYLFQLTRRGRAHRRRLRRATTITLVAEPTEARSCSFVGTHEYVAPEVARGGAHGAAVDWWAYGVFLYELLHGRTPFAGADNESTLRNIARRPLAFPDGDGEVVAGKVGGVGDARDLVARLLAKDPSQRLGSRRGAADVKAHRFFRGVNFALLRSSRPPVVPAASRSPLHRSQSCSAAASGRKAASKQQQPSTTRDARFDLF